MNDELAPPGSIWVILVRYGWDDRVGRFGSLRRPNVVRDATVMIASARGEELGRVVGTPNLLQHFDLSKTIESESTDRPATGDVSLTGEFIRLATAEDLASVEASRAVAVAVLAEATASIQSAALPVMPLDAETFPDGLTTIVYFLGEADARLGRLAVQLCHDGRQVRFQAAQEPREPDSDVRVEFDPTNPNADALDDLSHRAMSPTRQETIKQDSRLLRGDLARQLTSATERFDKDAAFLLQHHGVYQQKLREPISGAKTTFRFMLRVTPPGGRLDGPQWLELIRICRLGGGTLRLTSRQSVQLHGFAKADLVEAIRGLNDRWMTTLGACGDTVRNVAVCPRPTGGATVAARVRRVAADLSRLVAPATNTYTELWLDDQPIVSAPASPVPPRRPPGDEEHLDLTLGVEPILGPRYLPRKLKIGLTAGCNCLDLRTHDIGLDAVVEHGRVSGWQVYLGGGTAWSEDRTTTFPALGRHVGIIADESIVAFVQAVVEWHRDESDRSDRRQARLRYTIARVTVPVFLEDIASRAGVTWEHGPPPDTLPPAADHLGVLPRQDGNFDFGLTVPWGRLADDDHSQRLSALARIAALPNRTMLITPRQNLLIERLSDPDTQMIAHIFQSCGWQQSNLNSSIVVLENSPGQRADRLARDAMACVAFPTCSLAVAEAERVADEVIAVLFEALSPVLPIDAIRWPTVAIAGCGNGCSRPLTADLGLIGRGPGIYDLVVGGNGIRLGRRIASRQTVAEIGATIRRAVSSKPDLADSETAWPSLIERLFQSGEILERTPSAGPDATTTSLLTEGRSSPDR